MHKMLRKKIQEESQEFVTELLKYTATNNDVTNKCRTNDATNNDVTNKCRINDATNKAGIVVRSDANSVLVYYSRTSGSGSRI